MPYSKLAQSISGPAFLAFLLARMFTHLLRCASHSHPSYDEHVCEILIHDKVCGALGIGTVLVIVHLCQTE